jgi:prophage regulatory protein
MIKKNPSIKPLSMCVDGCSAAHPRLCTGRDVKMIAVIREPETDGRVSDEASGPRRMLNEKQVLGIVPVSRSTLFRMEKAGRFPRSTYISPNRRIWYADEISAWQHTIDEFNPNRGRGKGRRSSVAG